MPGVRRERVGKAVADDRVSRCAVARDGEAGPDGARSGWGVMRWIVRITRSRPTRCNEKRTAVSEKNGDGLRVGEKALMTQATLPHLFSRDPEALRRLRNLYERLRQILVDRFETVDAEEGAFVAALELYVQLAVMRVCEREVWARLREVVGGVVGDESADEPVVSLLCDKLREITDRRA